MSSTTTTPENIQYLRRSLRDLVGLSMLPAMWRNAEPSDIASGLAEILQRTLVLDFIYVRAKGMSEETLFEAACRSNRPHVENVQEVEQALAPWLNSDSVGVHAISNPFGSGTTQLMIISLGYNGNNGFVAAGSRRVDFPTETERVLLTVGANQAAIMLERNSAEKELKEADKRKDEFLAMLAHELRNPLAPIRSAISVLQKLLPPDSTLQWARTVIDRQSEHLSRLVDDLLDVSRITQGKITLSKEPIDVTTIIDRAVEATRPIIDERKQHLTVSVPAEVVQVEGDLTRLSQVVSNLLHNAAKYTEDGGQISLVAEGTNGEVVLSVRDTGIGMSPDFLPHVFELFAQADRSLDRSSGGLGIGLTVVRSLVQMHGGTVEASSQGLGRGSEFVVRLPALQEARRSPVSQTPPPTPSRKPLALRILIVDDNVDSAESLALLLQLNAHQVKLVTNGLAAMELSRSFQPQVIFLDIGLPLMDGYKVAEKLREQAETRAAVLIALTGYGRSEDRMRSKEVGFDYHVVKPVDYDDVLALINSHPFPAL